MDNNWLYLLNDIYVVPYIQIISMLSSYFNWFSVKLWQIEERSYEKKMRVHLTSMFQSAVYILLLGDHKGMVFALK